MIAKCSFGARVMAIARGLLGEGEDDDAVGLAFFGGEDGKDYAVFGLGNLEFGTADEFLGAGDFAREGWQCEERCFPV